MPNLCDDNMPNISSLLSSAAAFKCGIYSIDGLSIATIVYSLAIVCQIINSNAGWLAEEITIELH